MLTTEKTKSHLTTVRVALGEFECHWHGERIGNRIVNGSLGLSGRDTGNMYGFTRPGHERPVWCGTLAETKRRLAHHLAKS